MGFIQPCFIRKNTSELRNKLEEFGYWNGGKERTYGEHDSLYCNGYFGQYYECVQKPSRYESIIDCGDNEELFLAIAALRDDTDKNQWIIDEANEAFGLNDSFMICDKDDMNDRAVYTHYRKATVKEITEYFKNIK